MPNKGYQPSIKVKKFKAARTALSLTPSISEPIVQCLVVKSYTTFKILYNDCVT